MKRVRDLSAQSLGVLTAQLRSVPRKLFAICIIQIIVLVAGIFISRPRATCDIVHIAHSHYGIDCNRCHPTTGLYFGEFVMILGGVSVIAVGMCVRQRGALACAREPLARCSFKYAQHTPGPKAS